MQKLSGDGPIRARGILSRGRDRHHVVGRQHGSGVEQSGARQSVGMIADKLAIVSFNHRYAGVMVHDNDTNRYTGEDLAHNG